MNRKLKVLDLFSGIGGFALGLDSTGFFETVKFVEMDKYCQKVLRKNFPNIPIEEDIKNVEGKEYEADVITGGFPCQPFSVAGKQKGTNDNRYLWPEMLRLIREVKPEFVIGENVQGLINLQNGVVLRQVQDQLESEGFEVQCFLIPASGIGAWHQRYRVWIVGHSQHNGLLAAEKRCRDEKDYGGSQKGENETIELERTSGSRDNENVSNTNTRLSIGENEKVQTRRDTFATSGKDRNDEGRRETSTIKETIVSNTNDIRFKRDQQTTETTSGRRTETTTKSSGEDVSNTERNEHKHATIGKGGTDKVWRFYSEEEEKNTYDLWSETSRCDGVSREGETDVANTNKQRTQVSTEGRHTGIEMSGSSSQKTWWQIESNICGVPNGISYELDKNRANRIKTLGNAIVPQIAREFGLAIKKVLSDS